MDSDFSIDAFHEQLQSLPAAKHYHIAYSGGLDSHVLLFVLYSLATGLAGKISAIHINHKLNPRANTWVKHCRKVCHDLGVDLDVIEVDANAPGGESPESWARKIRYAAMENRVKKDEMLLTAHNRDDQAETLLIQLLRGAGPAGLAAMPDYCRFGGGYHGRPMLEFNRQQLHEFAVDNGLQWIEDDSNTDTGFDRNFIRHEILPRLRDRWPSVTGTLSRTARLQAQSAQLLEDLGQRDLAHCLVNDLDALDINSVRQLSPARCSNLLRHWIKTSGYPVPDSRHLQQIRMGVLDAKEDANPCVSWPGAECRRYRNYLFVMKPLPESPANQNTDWRLDAPCRLPLGTLVASHGKGQGIKAGLCTDNALQIRFRAGGEVIRRVGSRHHQQLKKLFQEFDIPPWLRDYIPLLYKDDRLVSVAGKWIDQDFAATDDEEAWDINWTIPADIAGQRVYSGESVSGDGYRGALDDDYIVLQLLYEKWLKKDEWLLKNEALPLLLGKDPADNVLSDSDVSGKYWKKMQAAVKTGELPIMDADISESQWRAGYEDIYRWAISAGIHVPGPLEMLMGFILKSVKRETAD